MEYRALAETFADIASRSGRLEKTEHLADLFAAVEPELLPAVTQLVQGRVYERWASADIGVSSARTREAISRATGISEEEIEELWREAGDLGDAAARAVERDTQATLVARPLTVERVYDVLRGLAEMAGPGSTDRRVGELAGLLSDADPLSAKFIVRTAGGAMRLGVGEGLIRDAIAWAFLEKTEAAEQAVKRAYEVTNDFGRVAVVARNEGRSGLDELDLELFRPIKPMLAQRSEDLETAMADLADPEGRVMLEVKYDGIRAKVHGDGQRRELYTRRLETVTTQFPDVMDAVRAAIEAEQYIVEAEIVGIDPDTGRPVPFQQLSRRIKRKHDIETLAEEIPVHTYVFDLLYLDGRSLVDAPLRERLRLLDDMLTPASSLTRVEHCVTASLAEARAFREDARSDGHEGVMVKNLDATYEPGSRVGYQQKVKDVLDPLDLAVTRAKWSEGRKREFLGRPYLACRNADGDLLEVGRMHSGFTDEQLAEFTDLVEPLIQQIDGREAIFRPEVVLEVECAEIQQSPTYESGYALRFPRLKRIRQDLDVADVDTIDRVAELYASQSGSQSL